MTTPAPAARLAARPGRAGRLLLGGFLSLAILMGIGRFHYTPLLPLMQQEYGFGTDVAGLVASVNFAGYLLGSILSALVPRGRPRLLAFRIGILTSVATTLLMGLTDWLPAWLALRGLSGMASAFGMIAAVGIVSDALGRVGAEERLAWVFGGVGCGIAASGLLTEIGHPALSADGLWIAAGLGCLALLPLVLREIGERDLGPPPNTGAAAGRLQPRPIAFWPLLVNYTCEGLGYSVFATFIVTIVKSQPGLGHLGDFVWIVVGLAGLPSNLLWSRVARRIGFAAALALCYVGQIVGVALPALGDGPAPAVAGALLFGGTFMAITFLTGPLGRRSLGGRGFAVLTAGFGLGQMTGPLIAGLFVTGPEDFAAALLASAGILAFGLLFLVGAMIWRPAATA